jgi:hypothetical protein
MLQSFLKTTSWILTCVFVLFLFACRQKSAVNTKKNEPTHTVKIQFTQTESYCGGARPSEEMLENLAIPKAALGKPFFIKSGNQNDPDNTEFVFVGESNGEGFAEFKLSKGEYCLVFDEKKDRNYVNDLQARYSKSTEHYSALDQSCIETWLTQPDLFIEVKDSALLLGVNIHKVCSWQTIPCVDYRGPLPP